METKKFSGFNENGYLPYGMYNMTFEEFKSQFGENTPKRKEIFEEYEKFLAELKNTGYLLDHWIDGSFVTAKENPGDIDTLTEFDGIKVDKNKDNQRIDYFIVTSKSKSNGLCHSWRVYRYPPSDKENYIKYLTTKSRILTELFGRDRHSIPKGVVHLMEETL